MALVGLVVFAWYCAFKIIPTCLLSIFRYRLWRLRDEIVDEIRHGKYHGTKQPRALARDIECFIEGAPDISPLNIGLLFLSSWGVHPPADDLFDFSDADRRDQRRLSKHVNEFQRTLTRHVFLHTPSGWLLIAPALPFMGLYKLKDILRRLRHKSRGDGIAQSAERLVVNASFELLNSQAHHHQDQPLSQAI